MAGYWPSSFLHVYEHAKKNEDLVHLARSRN